MADHYNLATDVYETLSSAAYLHNHYLNFLIATNNLRVRIQDDARWKERTNKILDYEISICEKREKIFYKHFRVQGRSQWQDDYLISNLEPQTINSVIGHIINSRDFADILEKEYKAAIKFVTEEEIINRQMGKEIGEDFLKESLKNFSYTLTTKNPEKTGTFTIISSIAMTEEGKKLKRSQEKIKEAIKEKTIEFITDGRRPPIRYLKNKFQEYNIIKSEKYLKRFKEVVRTSLDNSSLSGESNKTGFVLEILFPILFGDEWENLANITQDGKKVETDTIVRIGDGQEFKIQLKNSFDDIFRIKIKESFSYKDLRDKISVLQPELINELDYLIGNMAFFNKTKDKGKNGAIRPTLTNAGAASDYLKYIFNSIITLFFSEYLIGVSNTTLITKNDFYIYQGKYLIPASNFFKSAKAILNEGLEKNSIGLVQLPALDKLESQTNEDAKRLLREKRKAIKEFRKNNIAANQEYSYPPEILNEGAGKATNIALGVTGKSFYYALHQKHFEGMLIKFD